MKTVWEPTEEELKDMGFFYSIWNYHFDTLNTCIFISLSHNEWSFSSQTWWSFISYFYPQSKEDVLKMIELLSPEI